jgi:hypothetical protein
MYVRLRACTRNRVCIQEEVALKKILQVAFLSVATGMLALAVPVACPTGQGEGLSLDSLLGGGNAADGCFLGDKIFDAWQQTANGGVAPADTLVSFVQVDEIYKVTVAPNVPWTADMNLSYNVTVTNPGWWITTVTDQAFFGPSPTGDEVSFGVDPNNGALMTQIASNNNPGEQTVQFNGLTATSLAVSSQFTSAPNGVGAGQLFSVESSFVQAVPEPSTFALLGMALTAVAFIRRKKKA